MNYKSNTHCYTFKSINYNDSLLKSVDATYIIHLENNGRLQDVESQLEKYHPSKQVYIVFNKGYKKCNKILKEQSTTFDLKDANLNILQHSIDNNHKTILVLEDDYIFSDKINTEKGYLDEFLFENKNEAMIYYIGCLPLVNIPIGLKHLRMFWGQATHSCIYTESVKQNLLRNSDSVNDWDMYLNSSPYVKRYRYYIPLCYQTFPQTENRNNWKNVFYFGEYLSPIIDFLIKILQVDKKPEPTFTIIYILSYILTAFIIFVLVYLLYRTSKLFLSKNIQKKLFLT